MLIDLMKIFDLIKHLVMYNLFHNNYYLELLFYLFLNILILYKTLQLFFSSIIKDYMNKVSQWEFLSFSKFNTVIFF